MMFINIRRKKMLNVSNLRKGNYCSVIGSACRGRIVTRDFDVGPNEKQNGRSHVKPCASSKNGLLIPWTKWRACRAKMAIHQTI